MSEVAALPRAPVRRQRLRVRVIDFLALSPAEQDTQLLELLALDQAVFSGAQRVDLEPYLRDPRARAVHLVLYRNEQGRLVGQNIIPIVNVGIDGRTVAVANSIAAMLPAYRRSGRSQLDAGRVIMAFKLRHPLTPLYGACAMMHPRVYAMFIGRCQNAWPRPDAPLPASLAAILRAVVAQDQTVHEAAPGVFVQRDLPPPRMTASEAQRLRALDDPLTAFYQQHVPHFAEGQALYCIMPFTLSTLWTLGRGAVRARWGRR